MYLIIRGFSSWWVAGKFGAGSADPGGPFHGNSSCDDEPRGCGAGAAGGGLSLIPRWSGRAAGRACLAMRKANGGLPSGATTEVGGAAGVPDKSASRSGRAIARARSSWPAQLGPQTIYRCMVRLMLYTYRPPYQEGAAPPSSLGGRYTDNIFVIITDASSKITIINKKSHNLIQTPGQKNDP